MSDAGASIRLGQGEFGAGSSALPSFPGLSRVAPLDNGGMGSVYRAWQDDLSRPVAVKTLRDGLRCDPQLRERFVREARILARLDHPGIVPVYFAGETDRGPYYVMRLVEGVGIDRHLANKSPHEIASAFESIARALAVAHHEGVLHRDLKPANLLVESDGRTVLVDFGLSTHLVPGTTRVADEHAVGTLDYIAPEILAGQSASVASDVYALGVSLYVVLAGRPPFASDDPDETLRAIREDDPPLPRAIRPDVPKALQAICLKAIERWPADRYASAEEFARDLERFVVGDVVRAFPVRSRSLLRRKIELHLADHADWVAQGLLDPHQQSALQQSYEHLDEQGRGLLRGVFGSLPNLLLFVGILVSVFGPTLLDLVTWNEQSRFLRFAVLGAPLALLLTAGLWRWRADDRRRAVACWFGATLLAVPAAFVLADLVPALRTVVDDAGTTHAVLPGELWMPSNNAPTWILLGAELLEWKVLITSIATLAAAALVYRGTRAAAFLWIVCIAGLGAVLCAAPLLGWRDLPVGARWGLALAGSLATLGVGSFFDRSFRRDRAQPFYGLGFVSAIFTALTYADANIPMSFIGVEPRPFGAAWSISAHGLLFVAGGLAIHARGTAFLRRVAAAPLFVGLLMTLAGFGGLSSSGSVLYELALVFGCIAFLVLGLALHRNSLVLPAAIALPIAVGSVSQRHVDALWAWSAAVVLGGAVLVLTSFRIGAERARGTP